MQNDVRVWFRFVGHEPVVGIMVAGGIVVGPSLGLSVVVREGTNHGVGIGLRSFRFVGHEPVLGIMVAGGIVVDPSLGLSVVVREGTNHGVGNGDAFVPVRGTRTSAWVEENSKY